MVLKPLRATIRNILIAAVLVMVGVLAVSIPLHRAGAASPTVSTYRLELQDGTVVSFPQLVSITAEVKIDRACATCKSTQPNPPTVVLKRPQDTNRSLWQWYSSALVGGSAATKDATVKALDANGNVVFSYYMRNAYPAKLTVTTAKTASGIVLSETATLTGDLQRTQ